MSTVQGNSPDEGGARFRLAERSTPDPLDSDPEP